MVNRIVNKILYTLNRTHRKLSELYYSVNELPKIVFVHVPKCGGTSICIALKNNYNDSYYRVHIIPTHKASKLYFKTQEDYINNGQFLHRYPTQIVSGSLLFTSAVRERKCLTGHIFYNRKMLNTLKEMGYKFVTVIRHPVNRLFSNYFFDFYKQQDFNSINENFEEYLRERPNIGSTFIRYFGGIRSDNIYNSSGAINCAIENLKEYDMIGQLDEINLFMNEMEQKLGISLKISASNKNPASKNIYNEFKNSREKRTMVREICQPDLKLIEQLKAMNLMVSPDST